LDGNIKKHELTRPDKEEDRKVLTRYLKANIEPVFFTYRAVPEIDQIVSDIVNNNKADWTQNTIEIAIPQFKRKSFAKLLCMFA
jgi:uncharacterized protein (DUF1015 family)